MKELRTIIKAYQTVDLTKTRAALATVVRVEGSSYRRAGARMLVLDDGTYLGGVSGGCLEGDARRRAQKAIGLGYSSVITYDTTQDDDYQVGVGLGCQGIIDVLFTPLDPAGLYNPVKLLAGLTGIREPSCIVAITGGSEFLGRTFLYRSDGLFLSDFPLPAIGEAVLQDIRNCLNCRQSRTMTYTGGEVKVFIEIVIPATQIVIYGSNNDIYPMLRLAGDLGWDTTVVTNMARAEKTLLTMATQVLDHKAEAMPLVDAYTAILLMTHDYKTDLRLLKQVLQTNAPYIGILGPRKRAVKMYEAIAGEGNPVSAADSQRIYAPAGLDIGASTPEEIALSILAEVRSQFAGRQGMSLRLRDKAIYDDSAR